ncbi:MAG: glutamyl-tRNA(Gln) and/or aspartyl-tRNA(Asn) amidotransferase, subunit [Bacteroidota bacterium]|jgi:aspartyl-tRNA(Asn)/glutamyl-tRNA(Gln) amidotransferase subunit B|nr:glutamyl-tRNA(Gln) and/or aspartyl-tRNA(Asn) amidotransferase, subunit [Bacteroidota bacterium]
MNIYDKYEAVIGLEIHAQLSTKSKAYAADSTEYGVLPNTNVSPITLGHPGTLPRSNKRVIEYAVRLGLAVKSDIREVNEYARKNYFYADLPKGYQITQDKTPICTGGYITIKQEDGTEKNINITRIHMEEDAGKSIHDIDPTDSLIDLNRAGVALLEIVSEPEIRSGEEAYKYVTEVRRLVRYLDICDGNMEEGSMRCDANVSVRLKGSKEFGKRTETKNMNSMRNVQRAIEYEIKRQIDAIERGEVISQDTMNFDAVTGTTSVLRSKEMANDYRYFPEPDLQPVLVTQEYVNEVKRTLPPLPNDLYKKYISLGLSDYDAGVLTDSKEIALYFEEIISKTKNVKSASNWLTVQVKSFLNDNAIHISDFKVRPERIAQLVDFIDSGKVSHTMAIQKIFPKMMEELEKTPAQIAEENNWIQESNTDALAELAKQAISKFPEKVAEYKAGKTSLLGLFMGEMMKLSKGKADPKVASDLVKKLLDE